MVNIRLRKNSTDSTPYGCFNNAHITQTFPKPTLTPETMADASAALKRHHPDDDAGNATKKAKPDIAKIMAEARAKLATRAATLKAPQSSSPSPTPIPVPAPTPGSSMSAAQQRLAEMKKRLSSTLSRSTSAAAPMGGRIAPFPSAITFRPPPREDLEPPEEQARARGGLDVGLHPALLADSDPNSLLKKQAIQPKYATTLANRRTESLSNRGAKQGKKKLELTSPSPDISNPAKNPYYDPSIGTGGRGRASKALIFNQKGKYIEQANALRRQAALEAMKKRIAETARKVGIDEDMETDKAFLREPPPEIEWWDQGLTTNSSYDDIAHDQLCITTDGSIITIYIQHPIQLEPPQEKHIPLPKPLPLTAKEQAKKRRQKRMEDLKEKQAKQRLGLEPAPPPKMTRANMMRVMGEEAVKNPTAVEARVDREIAERYNKHMQENEERKLTKEQKEEKLQLNREKDLQKGIYCVAFRLEHSHLYIF